MIRFSDPFGGSSTALIDVVVMDCGVSMPPPVVLHRGEVLPIFVPAAFAGAYDAGEIGWEVTGPDGAPLPDAISPVWDDVLGGYVLLLDTEGLEVGEYEVVVPIGAGETEKAAFTVGVVE